MAARPRKSKPAGSAEGPAETQTAPTPLQQYADKRSFEKTPEPKPEIPVDAERAKVFCVQRHDARQLHYDLRIEIGGTLKSWAVPHGPTLDPGEKRLAVLVEDHPLEYATWEGNIPQGQYGGGSMMLWDIGTWELADTASTDAQLARGDFKFRLHGHKLKGEFALIRLKNSAKGNEWLLIKKKDVAANPDWQLDRFAYSVSTGRTQEEIALEMPARHAGALAQTPDAIPGARKAPMPKKISPMLASIGERIPTGSDWVFEIKWDGVRAIVFIDDGKTTIVGRHGTDMNRQYPELRELHKIVRAKSAVLDGEIVALDETGKPVFQRLQPRIMAVQPGAAERLAKTVPVQYFAFDLLYADGFDLRGAPLQERKRMLKLLLDPHPSTRVSDHFDISGADLFAAASAQGLEGILAKRANSKYVEQRTTEWLKFKVATEGEFVICGWTEGERDHFGALVLGYYENGKMCFAGTVGTGFDRQLIADIAALLRPLETTQPLFDPGAKLKKIHWTKPSLVATIRYNSWTADSKLRGPVFVGLRPDIDPLDCEGEPVNPGSPAAPPPPRPALLAETQTDVRMTIESKQLHFTNLGKLYYPKDGIKKRDVINYYDAVASLLIPHWKDRPLSLRRYPEGIEGESFFQKHAEKGYPDWMRVERIIDDESDRNQFIGEGRPELLVLANMGCIDQNPWMSRVESLDNPDFLLIDLDPYDCSYDKIVEAAHVVRRKLDALGLESYPKTTGGDGLHLYVPLEPVYTYEHSKQFAEVIARLVATERPDLFTTPRAVEKREKNRVYFDYLQNGKGKTISAPYVLRAYPGAPVATPLEWREVVPGLRPQQFHIRNAMARFDRVGDLFAGVLERKQRLEPAFAKLEEILRAGR